MRIESQPTTHCDYKCYIRNRFRYEGIVVGNFRKNSIYYISNETFSFRWEHNLNVKKVKQRTTKLVFKEFLHVTKNLELKKTK